MPDKKSNKKRSGNRKTLIILLFLLLLLLIIFGVWFWRGRQIKEPDEQVQSKAGVSKTPAESLTDTHAVDSSAILDSLSGDSLAKAGKRALGRKRELEAERQRKRMLEDSIRRVDSLDSITRMEASKSPCEIDTIPPWILPDPSGGLHRRHVAVKLLSVEECEIQWRYGNEKRWRTYSGKPILITSDTILVFTARDTCGNVLPPRTEIYNISKPLAFEHCPDDMEYVKVGKNEFCIDRYEWPNKRGVKPISYVSINEARDSCFTVSKRLCETEEWMLACGGIYGWKFPYGSDYEPRACNTQDTVVTESGTKIECRGYFDIYDMSGNLAEWTNTPSFRNRAFYNVMGGFWDSGPRASCFEKRYSYFPQNRHNPVGFRCCADASK